MYCRINSSNVLCFELDNPSHTRLDGLPRSPFQTASHANTDNQNSLSSTVDQPEYPTNEPTLSPGPVKDATQRRTPRNGRNNPRAARLRASRERRFPPPFRNLAAGSDSDQRPPRRLGSAGRLWNPTNSTPRAPPSQSTRRRRPSTPQPPVVPLNHPVIDITADPNDPIATAVGHYPLLTLPEQRQNRHSASTRASLQIEGRASGDKRISLPSSVRHSYDNKRISNPPPEHETGEAGPSHFRPLDERPRFNSIRKRGQSVTRRARALSFGLVHPGSGESSPKKADKGKGKAIMPPIDSEDPARGFSQDIERGPAVLGHHPNRSTISIPDGISAISSSDSSIMGDPDQPDLGEAWGPQHPCFPHLNPHVPTDSPEYITTRIIRVRRDWLIKGDLAPTFSNLYPEILDPAGVSEQEFRRVIEKLNSELTPTFNPYNWRNILDGVLGLLTGWIWDDLGLTYAKSHLRSLEKWIESWNAEMEKAVGSEDSTMAPKIIPLRRTAYMSLDIQIPDPEISMSNSEPASRSGPHMPHEPEPAAIA
ncbi:Golgin subfamily A member 7/ERF4 family-domain-containing protein [Xylariomycetidae sp. FL2044]|nr:Golgin subfamily A member 7/ERF4 family-domain-containing protein [Xylariomycetidae sp. FL2044]